MSAAPRFFVQLPYPGGYVDVVPDGTQTVTVAPWNAASPPIPPAAYEGLTLPSAARAVVVPALAPQWSAQWEAEREHNPALSTRNLLFLMDEGAPPRGVGIALSLDVLAAICDDQRLWNLAAAIAGILGINPRAIPYRGCAAGFPPVLPFRYEEPQRPECPDPVEWMAVHGYSPVAMAQTDNYVVGTFARLPGEAPSKSGYAVVCLWHGEPTGKPTKLPAAVVAIRDELPRAGEEPLAPVIFVLPEISDFAAEWAEAQRHPRVFPVARRYFTIRSGDHCMFPRFYPAPQTRDAVPEFHPGPALYSWRSAPYACNAFIFEGRRDGIIIRTSHHTDPIDSTPREEVHLA